MPAFVRRQPATRHLDEIRTLRQGLAGQLLDQFVLLTVPDAPRGPGWSRS